jgi:signal transduction histidine kinase
MNQEEDIVITVKDTGPGISKKDLDRIFDPFFTRKKTMGMGVGLSICCGIVEDHKGTIVADNLPEGGAVLTIRLPLA